MAYCNTECPLFRLLCRGEELLAHVLYGMNIIQEYIVGNGRHSLRHSQFADNAVVIRLTVDKEQSSCLALQTSSTIDMITNNKVIMGL